MTGQLVVYKNRRNVIPVGLGIDVSADTITSEIRALEAVDATLIATWTVTFLTDGTDGELLFTLDDSVLSAITVGKGFMDGKRVSGGEPFPIFAKPIEVLFQDSVTA